MDRGDPDGGLTGHMDQITVSVEQIHRCASAVDDAGNEFGRDVESLRGETSDAGLYGGDELGQALLQMDQAACPDALRYYRAAGEATCETAGGLDQMAGIYTASEQDNTAAANAVVDDLGVF